MVECSSNHKAHVLEKYIWGVATLGVLADGPFAQHLTFKGGTSPPKVWRAIRRFSEDVDVTYDIRAFAPAMRRFLRRAAKKGGGRGQSAPAWPNGSGTRLALSSRTDSRVPGPS